MPAIPPQSEEIAPVLMEKRICLPQPSGVPSGQSRTTYFRIADPSICFERHTNLSDMTPGLLVFGILQFLQLRFCAWLIGLDGKRLLTTREG